MHISCFIPTALWATKLDLTRLVRQEGPQNREGAEISRAAEVVWEGGEDVEGEVVVVVRHHPVALAIPIQIT